MTTSPSQVDRAEAAGTAAGRARRPGRSTAAARPRRGCRPAAASAGVSCPGELPPPSDPDLVARARARPGGRSATAPSSSATTISATRSSSSPTSPATPSSWPARPRPGRRPSTWSSAACTSWPSRPTSSPRRAAGRPARPGGRLFDGRHGHLQPGRGVLGRARGPRHRRRGDPRHVHELLRRHQGVHRPSRRHRLHVVQREPRAEVGARSGQQGAVPARPAPGPQHRGTRDGHEPGRLRRLGPAPGRDRRPRPPRQLREGDHDPLARPLLRARPVLRRVRHRGAASGSPA